MTKIGKIFKWVFLLTFALIIIGGVSLWLFFPVEKAKLYAIEKGEELLEREILIETASVSFWGGIGIQLENITIKNQKEFSNDDLLTAKSLDVKLQFFPLISGNIAIDRLILKEPQIKLYKLQNEQNNFTFEKLEKKVPPKVIKQATPEAKAAAAIITFENIVLQNGSVRYQDDSKNRKISLDGINLVSTLIQSYDNMYNLSGELSIDDLIVADSLGIPGFNILLNYDATINQLDNSITITNTDLTLNQIKTSISGSLENIFSNISAKLNIQSEQIDIAKLIKLVPTEKKNLLEPFDLDGNLSFDFDLKSNENEFQYNGSAMLNDVSVAHRDIPGKFLCKEALVDIKENNLRFNITKGEFDGKPIKGYVAIDNFEDPFINGAFAGLLKLKFLEPFLPTEQKHELNGLVKVEIKASGKIKDVVNLKFNGTLQADNIAYNSSFMLEPVDSLAIEIHFDNEIILIKKLSALTQSGSFSLEGRITSLLQYLLADSTLEVNPTIDAKLKGDLQLSVLNKILPPKGNPNLKGDLTVDLQLSGAVNNLSLFKPFGKVNIRNGSYTDDLLPEKMDSFDAQLTISPDTIIVHELHSQFETSDATFQGKLVNPFPYLLPISNLDRKKIKKPLFIFNLISNRFDADKLFPEAVPGVSDGNSRASLDSISTIIFPDIDGRGEFSIDTLIYSKVELTALTGKVSIDNKKIDCYDVKGNVYSGKIEGNTTIDLTDFNNPHYVGSFNMIQIEVNDFAKRFSKLKNIIFGKIDMQGSYNASGWEPEQFLNSLTMNSTSSIRQGKVYLSNDILSESNKSLKNLISGLQNEQTIRNLFTNIIVEDGKVSFDKFATKLGELGNLEIDGFYGFNGSISYDGKLKLTKELTKKITTKLTDKITSQNNLLGNITKFLTKEISIGQIVINPKFYGTIDDPKFSLGLPSILK